ncbi:putative transmembrane anti-sigma factor [Pseudarthrobacter chlorophenolicus A6]|uniref:Transmembrane anti-sigma factor n=1 Tax=Pseudarthrobacter chlorophenolicus (strain ATCC 700700 / DSM 12829 / CIP 107037 / JCM 12360 / KCTC 9906 / NCIMB 13794 / A6) TaxID=452863 RepID=B8HHH4_PSECP|nr:zf-HC2 domain-containing protein [Pseudarthrobacter chlorophenolicus]ACL41465.1 putative transmembrane anti-sigma factor [Pseudarthrobacter chlorophenolicus A6]SDQ63665.1 Putative zinc-finger [Pseudarthrobacter chlorophenolicus]
MTADPHQLLGAYLLGGLDAGERAVFEAHLGRCRACRDELAGLETLPALLDALPVPDALALTSVPGATIPGATEPNAAESNAAELGATPSGAKESGATPSGATEPGPAGELAGALPTAITGPAVDRDAASQPLLHELARRRRTLRRRWAALAGAAAAACLAVGLAVGPLLVRAPQPDATYSVQSGGGLQFSIDLARKTWGTELAVNGSSLPSDGTLSLWVRDRDGGEDRACAWTATPSGRVKVTGATPIQLGRISSVELRDGTQQAVAVITVP